MFKRLLVTTVLLLGLIHAQPFLLNSSHTHDSFQLTLSIAPETELAFYSKKIVRSSDHWALISTKTTPATIVPPFPDGRLLINTQHEGRHLLQYYEKSISNDINRHFHYAAVAHNGQTIGYLLPSFSETVPAFRTDKIYRCSNTIVSVEWMDQSAHIMVFGQEDNWRIEENIDGGFRSDERGLYYGYAVDAGHVHPVKVFVGDREFCTIDRSTPAANVDFKW